MPLEGSHVRILCAGQRPHLFIVHLAILVLVNFCQDLINVLVQVSWQSLQSHSRMPEPPGWEIIADDSAERSLRGLTCPAYADIGEKICLPESAWA